MRKLFGCVVVVGGLLTSSVFAQITEVSVTFTNKEVDGKKVWLPTTVELPANTKINLKLVNTLKGVHGFQVPNMTDPFAVRGNETANVSFKTGKAGEYPYKCHMHAAHVGGKIIVK